MVLTRQQVSKDAELLVLRHENTVLRRQIGRVRYEPGDRLWLAALSRWVPRRRWGEVFMVTPAGYESSRRRSAAVQAIAMVGGGIAGHLDGQHGGVDDAQPGDTAQPQPGSATSPGRAVLPCL